MPISSAFPRRRAPRRGDLKERAILDTAERLLGEKALADIGVDELAKGAGISRPTFYFYFQSKEAVLPALVGRIADEMQAATEQWLQDLHEDPRGAVSRSVAAAANLWREHGAVMRAAVQAWETSPEMRPVWEAAVGRFVEVTSEKIRSEQEAGRAPSDPDPRELAQALVWMTERCFYTTSLGAETALSERELVPILTEVWLRAMYGDRVVTSPAAA
jgi:AcrR family transcriptional regulator